jgi:hypothetical protein
MRSTIFSSTSLAAFSEAELIQRAKAREETAIRAILKAEQSPPVPDRPRHPAQRQ